MYSYKYTLHSESAHALWLYTYSLVKIFSGLTTMLLDTNYCSE